MSIRWVALLCLAVGLSLGAAAAGPALADTDADTDDDRSVDRVGSATVGENPEQLLPQTEGVPEADATVTRIALAPDGTAEWTLTVRIALDTDASIEEFEAFREEFAANESRFIDRFRDRITGVLKNARADTEREMNVTGFAAETGTEEFPQRWGYLSYRFDWTGFAVADGESVSVGDVFQGGLFLRADDLLFIEGPANYQVASVDPASDQQDDAQLQWNGPRSFADERPQVRFTADGTGGDSAAPGSPDDGETGTGTETGADGGLLVPASLLAAGAVAAGLALGVVYVRRRTDADGDDATGRNGSVDPTPRGASEDAETGVTGGQDGGLATDEDRVVALLREEGGRMRQAAIADQLDWSDSKASRVLSTMADEGTIEKLRIGRENVIDLRDPEDE